jgi:hypothetical protein
MKNYPDESIEYALKNNENDENTSECLKKICHFRNEFNLDIKDFPDEKIMKALIKNDGDEENAFAEFFQK